MIPDHIVDQVRESADIVGIISESVPLKRTGSDWRGACPFHGGKGRNFAVIPKKGMFYCYVCHEAGDVFSYFMKRFGMDYPTAVRDVARRVGITVPEEKATAGPDPNEPLLSAASAAHEFFMTRLAEGRDADSARQYLAGRGFDQAAVERHQFGYAPTSRDLLEHLEKLGINQEAAVTAGLAIRRDDGSVGMRFRGRLIIPIHDLRGRVVAFGGRILGEGEPKYLNSPETPIFHKGRTLYNLHVAKQEIRKAEEAVLVEGYFDVLALVDAGINNVVAPLGTALTPEQASLLRRFTGQVTVLYDSDAPGLRSTFRAADELLRQSVQVRVATMPQGEDPDTMVRGGGAAAVREVLHDAQDVLERKIHLLAERGWFEDLEHRRRALDRLLPTVRAAADPITRDLYLARVSERTAVSVEVLRGELRLQASRHAPQSEPAPPVRAPSGDRLSEVNASEAQMIQLLLVAPDWRIRAREELEPALFESEMLREIFVTLVESAHPADQLPGGLSHAAQLAWSELREKAERLAGANHDATYENCSQMLRSGPEWREIEELTDKVEQQRRRQEFRRRYPLAFDARYFKSRMMRR
ncbi:MAG TPA: DNA primase [Gemmatimonadales bacterium]|nr:DNA primase [Gemmatimonadales bacterium]